MSNNKNQYKLLSGVILCSLLFCACGQETEPPQKNAAALSETVEESAETEETADADGITSAPENAYEILAMLIEDEGFRRHVRYGARIEEEDSEEEVLQKLENCESIVLEENSGGNAIYSLESLSLLPNLKRLEIKIDEWDDSTITDFTPIAQLFQLEYLYISYAKEEQIDLSFLGQMSAITELFLVQCKIEDFSFLEQMPQLQCLSLYETHVDDLAVLEKLPELIELSLSGNENAQNIEAVGTLTKMQDLGIQYCGIEDISFLSGLTELRSVNLIGNSITDILPLAGLSKLECLDLSQNRIRDISMIGDMSNLFALGLNENEIQDISVLAKLPHLNQVGLSDNQIEDFSPLAGKEELMYAAVFGNPITNIEPLFEVPLLWYTDYMHRGVSEEEEAFVADWLAEYYPEAEEFECVDFIQGDLNNDGRQDIAFVVDSEAFQPPESLYLEDRRLFILLQQRDGSWIELEDTPGVMSGQSGGMRGDPYGGMFMQPGYLLIKEGWGDRFGSAQTEIYEYRNESLKLKKTISAGYDRFADGYDVWIRNGQDDTWQRYALAMDGYHMVRVDIEDSEHLAHKAFPEISLYNGSYYIYEEKTETQFVPSEALDFVLEAAVEDAASAVQETLPYTKWQKDGYELLLGVTLPEYYYVLPETKREADGESEGWEGDYLYYNGIISDDGRLYHDIYLIQEEEEREFLLDDATGDMREE